MDDQTTGFITLHVNKRFLILTAIVISVIVAFREYGTYKYRQGIRDTLEYTSSKLGGDSDNSTDSLYRHL